MNPKGLNRARFRPSLWRRRRELELARRKLLALQQEEMVEAMALCFRNISPAVKNAYLNEGPSAP